MFIFPYLIAPKSSPCVSGCSISKSYDILSNNLIPLDLNIENVPTLPTFTALYQPVKYEPTISSLPPSSK